MRRCLHCLRPIRSIGKHGASFCHAGCRERHKAAEQKRRESLKGFDDWCRAQSKRIGFQTSLMAKRIQHAVHNEPSPLLVDHDVQIRGRM